MLLENYDPTVPPGYAGNKEEITEVFYDINFKSVKQVSEQKMHLTLNLFEYTEWVDSRLAYQDDPRFDVYLKKDRIDLSKDRFSFWLPNMGYTEINQISNSTEVAYLYPNGTVMFYRKLSITFTCPFDFRMIPNDNHNCNSVTYIQNADVKQAVLVLKNKF